ncbi:OB-fold protein [Flavobacterium sp.]|uniref:OB-fold protein n=1 Tax=Flavobacterium sp. TaxID=239 RepID=UPI003D6BC9BA
MKNKLIIFIIAVVVLGFLGYSYLYKEHRNFADENAIPVNSVYGLMGEFKQQESNANKKYLDKVIQIKGKVTQIDTSQNTITIDEKLFSSFQKNDFKDIKVNEVVTLKGRFIGYDELLEECKLDNCVIIE